MHIGAGVKGTKKPSHWEEKIVLINKLSKGMKKNLSPEQLAERSRKKKEWWAMKKQEVANAA